MNHGGKRPGAGRPIGSTVETDDPKEQVSIRLERSLRERARIIGLGNETAGIRKALRAFGVLDSSPTGIGQIKQDASNHAG